MLFTCASPYPRIPVSIRHRSALPLGIGREKGLNGDLGLALLPKAEGTLHRSLSPHPAHQALAGTPFAAWGPSPTPPKTSGGFFFFLMGFQLFFWEGGTLHSQGRIDAFLTTNCWLQTCGKGVPSASLPPSFVILQVKTFPVSMSVEGFPAQQGDFPARLVQCFGGGWVRKEKKKHQTFPVPRGFTAPQKHTLRRGCICKQ